MQGDRWKRAETIFHAVVDLPAAEREAHLNELCSDDSELRAFVERLLRHHETGGGGVLDRRPSVGDTETTEPAATSGQTLGPYVLRERIGSGGMGEVWRAEQTTPVRRTVALKLIKAGMDSRQVIARFEAERQALALMDHPAIAKVFDAGTTPHGHPYFAMEYVPGVPITEYCDTRKLGTRERLALFQRVCEGVQHAHQKAVIHRDLKPSNILVSDVDGKPQPRIIDFGVAKATSQKLSEKTMYTALGQLIGTPEYMSPEQADLTVEDVDTRTDVYSLGVILYELLVGALPFEATELRKAGFEGIIRLLREKDPPRPSAKVSSLGERTTEVAANRRTEPRRLMGQLRGDLDWIVMRSLEKDRNRRYASPQELAQDLERHLQHEPVLAGSPSPIYRTKKFIRRHRIAVGFTATIALAVILGFVMLSVQNARIAAARDEAEAVKSTLEEMLASVDPRNSGRDVTVKEILDETANTLGERFKHRPLIEASLRHTVAKTYYALGEYDDAEVHFGRAISIRGRQLGETDPATLEAKSDLARTYMNVARYPEAEALLQEVLEASRRINGEDHPQTVHAMAVLGMCYNEHGVDAEAAGDLLGRALDLAREVFGEADPRTLDYMNALGITFRGNKAYGEAETLFENALRISRGALGEEHPITLKLMVNLAANHRARGNHDEAEKLLRRALEISRRVLGTEHRATLYSMWGLARVYSDQGRHDEAEGLYRECWEGRRRSLGERHPITLEAIVWLALTYARQGRREEVESLGRRALEAGLHIPDEGPWNALRYNLACVAALIGRRDAAISHLRDAFYHGYSLSSESIREDPDLASLHGDPEFEEIVAELKRRNEEIEPVSVEDRGSVERQ